MNDQEKLFLGTGWSFPPSFNNTTNDVKMVSMEEDIHQSLEIFFGTKLGERTMRSKYGCFIYDLVFERSSEELIQGLSNELMRSIMEYEPRINIIQINTNRSKDVDGIVELHMEYEIIATNNRINIVYPFYITEGTKIK